MPLISKSFADLNIDTTNRLISLGYTDAQYEGTAVRNIVESVDLHLANFYSDLQTGLLGQFLSTASGSNLDALGLIVGCTRRAGELDANYQYRISQQLTIVKTANLVAHLDALLSLSGLRNVIAKPFTQGAGSITFYLIATSGVLPSTTLAAASAALANITAAGAVSFITTPTPLYINVTATIATGTSTNVSASSLQSTANTAIANYISGLSMGDALIESKLVQAILDSSASISDCDIVTLSVTDQTGITTELLIANYTPLFNQQLFAGTISVS